MIVTVTCPACWQPTAVELAGYEGHVEQYEDCQVCCRPMRIRARLAARAPDEVYSHHESDESLYSDTGDGEDLGGGATRLLSIDVEADG